MYTKELFGKGVLDKGANNIGKVTDIDISVAPWAINSLIVTIGMGKKLTIGIDKVDKVGDKVMLNVGKSDLGL